MTTSTSNKKVIKLICVTEKNNNKFYIMTDLGGDNWEAQWGRVEGDLTNINQAKSQRKVYSSYQWDSMYRSKVGKGYKDVSHLYQDVVMVNDKGGDDEISVISNISVRKLISELMGFASNSVTQNYTISSKSVTQQMVDEAQTVLSTLTKLIAINGDVKAINAGLLRLYSIIPRKMAKVQNYLVTSLNTLDELKRVQKMIANEQDTLDVMAGQVKLNASEKESDKKQAEDKTKDKSSTISILDKIGIHVEEVTDQETAEIKKYLGPNAHQYKKAYKVINKNTQYKYDDHFKTGVAKNEFLFWHGSRNQNWFNIIQTGLLIRPTGAIHTGSMFGDGIYFADKAQKSIGYTSLRGSYWASGSDNKAFLALFRTNLGKPKHIHRHDSSCYTLAKSILDKEGFDSVHAHGGADLRNDEFIIYEANKCTIQYLIEIS